MKTKPTVWLCPEANDARSASGWLKGVARRGARLLKKKTPSTNVLGVLLFGRVTVVSPNVERSEIMCTKKQSLSLLGRDHCACTVGAAAGSPEASRSD